MISFFNIIQYHFRYWMIKCAQVFDVYFLCFCKGCKWILYYDRNTFTFYYPIWKILLIYGKVDSSLFAYIVIFLDVLRVSIKSFPLLLS